MSKIHDTGAANMRSTDLLPAPLTRSETKDIERRAVNAYRSMERTSMQFAADLRRLQDGGSHLLRGYTKFADYAESLFPGLTGANVSQISRVGNVLLILEERGLVNLSNKELPLGSQAARELSAINKRFSEEVMVETFQVASQSSEKMTGDSVRAALLTLVKPEPHQLGEGAEEPAEPDDNDDDDYVEEHSELMDRIQWLREQLDNVGDAVSARSVAAANRALDTVEEELPEVRQLVGEALEQTSKRGSK